MVPSQEVLSALDRLLASDNFINSERLSAFLRFTVGKTLAGDDTHLKEYLLGTEVFGRGPDFDPRLDPVVRVEARRLRAKLQEYYEGPGKDDPVRITIRKGGYAASFEHAAPQPVASVPGRKMKWMWVAAALLVAVSIAALVANNSVAQRTSVVVIPSAEQSEQQAFADGLAQAVAVELARDPRLRVVAWPKFAEYRQTRGGPGSITTAKTARDLDAGSVLTLHVRQREGRRHIFAVLMKPDRGYKEWAAEYERGFTDEFAVQREVARSIAEDARAKF